MEAPDQIAAVAEEKAEQEADDGFRNRAALLIAVLAMLLAITTLGGGNVAEDMINSNIQASDTWAFYQAKNIRQTAYSLAADELELELKRDRSLSPEVRAAVQEKLKKYQATVARYESEPDPEHPQDPLKGEGKKELRAQAEDYEKQRERAQEQDPNFDFAEALYQIAIVLASVAILALSRPILWLALGFGSVASLLMLNGYFLFAKLPF